MLQQQQIIKWWNVQFNHIQIKTIVTSIVDKFEACNLYWC